MLLQVRYIATENPFPVQLNGKDVAVDGYNIDGSTVFLNFVILQMSSAVLMLPSFSNNTIQLSKDGYAVY